MAGILGLKKNNPGCNCCPDPPAPQPDCTTHFFTPHYFEFNAGYGLRAVLDFNVENHCNCSTGPFAWFIAPDPAIIPNPIPTPIPSTLPRTASKTYASPTFTLCTITNSICLSRPVIQASPGCISLSGTWFYNAFVTYHSQAVRTSNDPVTFLPRYSVTLNVESVVVCLTTANGQSCAGGGVGSGSFLCGTSSGGLGSVTGSSTGGVSHFRPSVGQIGGLEWWEGIDDNGDLLGWPVVQYDNPIPPRCV